MVKGLGRPNRDLRKLGAARGRLRLATLVVVVGVGVGGRAFASPRAKRSLLLELSDELCGVASIVHPRAANDADKSEGVANLRDEHAQLVEKGRAVLHRAQLADVLLELHGSGIRVPGREDSVRLRAHGIVVFG